MADVIYNYFLSPYYSSLGPFREPKVGFLTDAAFWNGTGKFSFLFYHSDIISLLPFHVISRVIKAT